ncbi:LRR receptor-like serine/threonine-protein kinase FEI 1 [Selaginella moellendorffii]|uniref:LRR receptor-like serine/threonine-protein kinase FEI 1 n=1 Tax=Selaginella moellendorffii TaxID=88036 RepID=UPI000D1CA5F0|nr:LRR receptor-like serine/threonine-protein kinase FEI 1 [Selaginella moellendorffii]|eukprot:XP_024536370.1 LRR receptor-like serine/threonine-protein kinase FEI 1 [Selaginella moellendorffii]
MRSWAFCAIVVLFLHSVQALSSDGIALLAFKEGIQEAQFLLGDWRRSDATPCNWTGVECNGETGRVETLNLPRFHLVGVISPEIGKLSKLRRLGLHNNMISGKIPPSLGNCSDLRAVYLRDNLLSGSLPAELGRLKNLKVFDVSENSLTGPIPASMERLNDLVFLNVSNNFLTGSVTGLAKFSNRSFFGNPGLCGQQLNKSCEVGKSVNGSKMSKLSRNLLISALGTVTASLLFALVCFWGFLFYNKFNATKACIPQQPEPSAAKLVLFHGGLPYTLKEVITKIERLDYKDIIGAGGFGTVYKLCMDEDCVFAVKKVGRSSDGSISERRLEKELDVLGSIQHRNLVSLKGYCNAPTARLLITDFMPLGSLDEHLHERHAKDSLMTWEARLNIAIGTARGLGHLHHRCVPPIIHRDIKSSNVLLDRNLEACVSDFGLARLLEENDSQVTTIVAGTFGYLAPEYMQSGRATEKSDVYSYGVVLLELLSGKRPTDVCFTAKGLNIVGWASAMMLQNRCLEIFDPHCRGAQLESMEAVLEVAAMCIHPRPECRPSMATVAEILQEHHHSLCSSTEEDGSCASEFSLKL